MTEQEEKMKRNATNFAMYTYFNVDLSDIESKDYLIQIAVEKAYEDATLMGAYKYNIRDNTSNSDDAKDEAMKYLLEDGKIKDLIDPANDFDEQHREICCHLVEEIYKEVNKEKDAHLGFSYGNAQKWVNMTTKNLYVLAGLCIDWVNDELKAFCSLVINRSRCFHVPIDQIILRALTNTNLVKDGRMGTYIYSNGEGVACFDNGGNVTLGIKGKTGVKKVAWSTFDSYDFYDEFRWKIKEVIPEGQSPIEWECEAWIKQSKEDKNVN